MSRVSLGFTLERARTSTHTHTHTRPCACAVSACSSVRGGCCCCFCPPHRESPCFSAAFSPAAVYVSEPERRARAARSVLPVKGSSDLGSGRYALKWGLHAEAVLFLLFLLLLLPCMNLTVMADDQQQQPGVPGASLQSPEATALQYNKIKNSIW